MEINKLPGTGDSDKSKRLFVDFYQQWGGLLRPTRVNWIDFTFIKLACEFARYKGSFELNVGVLGLSWTITYLYDRSFVDELDDIHSQVLADLKGVTGAKEVIDPTGALDTLKGQRISE